MITPKVSLFATHKRFVSVSLLTIRVGVNGIGPVHAVEILSMFDMREDLEGGLQKFTEWFNDFDVESILRNLDLKEEKIIMETLCAARSRWQLPQNFPSNAVVQAFLKPVVDKSNIELSWASPDVEGLLVFCSRHIGWRPEETKGFLNPVLDNLNTNLRQTRLGSFIKYEDGIKFAKIKSERMRKALELMTKIRGTNETD